MPSVTRDSRSRYLWVVHKALGGLRDNLALLASADYWNNPQDVIAGVEELPQNSPYAYLSTRGLKVEDFIGIATTELDHELIFAELGSRTGVGIRLAAIMQGDMKYLQVKAKAALESTGDIEAVLLWANCASVRRACQEGNVRTIFNEVGPLRPPFFHPTAYFDFQGLHDQSEADARWEVFSREVRHRPVPTLSPRQVLDLVSRIPIKCSEGTEHTVGIGLQAPGEMFLEYTNGFSNYCMINFVKENFSGRLKVKPHPACSEVIEDSRVEYDASLSSVNFLMKVDSVVTTNSGLGFEAVMMGKKSYVLGRPSFALGTWDVASRKPFLDSESFRNWLNWFVFGYLIPFRYLFDIDYYRWRLGNPSEIEIYLKNLKWWKKNARS